MHVVGVQYCVELCISQFEALPSPHALATLGHFTQIFAQVQGVD